MQISKENYHEINHYPDPLFPVEIYRVDESGMFPFGRGVGDFHWHEELQFTMALQGTLTIQADARRYTLKEGQAFFINSGVIHAVTELSAGGVYASLNFPSKLLSFFPGSRMEQDDVLPWVTGGVPASLLLTCETRDGSAVLTCLSEILRFWLESFPHRSYGIAIRLAELWVSYASLPGTHRVFSSFPFHCQTPASSGYAFFHLCPLRRGYNSYGSGPLRPHQCGGMLPHFPGTASGYTLSVSDGLPDPEEPGASYFGFLRLRNSRSLRLQSGQQLYFKIQISYGLHARPVSKSGRR